MKYSINISSSELLYLTVEAETEPFEARRASNKKSGWGIKCLIHFFYPTFTRGFEPPTYRLGVRPNFASHVITSYQILHIFKLFGWSG